MHQAVFWNKIDVLRVLLEHDRSLGYVVKSDNGTPLLNCAAYQGHVMVARELLKHCPDTPYSRRNGWTCLHQAVLSEKTEFVEFVWKLYAAGTYAKTIRWVRTFLSMLLAYTNKN